MNLLASPKALALLDYIQRHDGRVAIDDLHAAFPANERWLDALMEADCIDTDGLAVDELPGVVNVHVTHYVLTPRYLRIARSASTTPEKTLKRNKSVPRRLKISERAVVTIIL